MSNDGGLCPLKRGDKFAIITCPMRLGNICCQTDGDFPKMPDEQRQALRYLSRWGSDNQPDQSREKNMHIAHRLARALSPTQRPRYGFGDYVDIAPGCFATSDRKFICWEGKNYVPQTPKLRTRLHNWLVRIGETEPDD